MKYIDTDKLIECIKHIQSKFPVITYEALFHLITSLQQEQPEVDLDALVNEAFDKYSSVDGYGQLVVSFNRTELYSFIKKITRKEK